MDNVAAQEFVNNTMYVLENTHTVDGYYFASRIAGMTLVDTNECSLAATDCKGTLFINSEELFKWFPDKLSRALIMAHEVRHNDGLHLDKFAEMLDRRAKDWGITSDTLPQSFHQLFNIITDVIINEGLKYTFPGAHAFWENGVKFGAVRYESLEKNQPNIIAHIEKLGYDRTNVWKVDPCMVFESIIDEALEKRKEQEKEQAHDDPNSDDITEEDLADKGLGNKKDQAHDDPNSDDITEEDLADKGLGNKKEQAQGEFNGGDLLDEDHVKKALDNGQYINKGMDVDQEEAKRIAVKAGTGRAMSAGLSGMGPAGATPGHLVGEFEELGTPKVSMSSLLRPALRALAKNRLRYSKPNKAYMAQGVFKPTVGGMKSGTIAILIDTSGSVGDDTLKDMMADVEFALKTLSFNKCVVIQFSNNIENIQEYDTRRGGTMELSKRVYGRGGTEIAAAINELEKHKDLSATVIFTDGGLYDIKGIEKNTTSRLFKKVPAYWMIPTDADTASPLRRYLGRGGHGNLYQYDEHRLTKETHIEPASAGVRR